MNGNLLFLVFRLLVTGASCVVWLPALLERYPPRPFSLSLSLPCLVPCNSVQKLHQEVSVCQSFVKVLAIYSLRWKGFLVLHPKQQRADDGIWRETETAMRCLLTGWKWSEAGLALEVRNFMYNRYLIFALQDRWKLVWFSTFRDALKTLLLPT